MAPIDLNQVRAFLAVHETGSFSVAALRAGVPRSTISRAVVGLERDLGVQLFYRTTRRVSTTSAGLALAARVATPLATLDASFAEMPDRDDEPSGLLRVTSTMDIGATLLAPAVTRFTARHPKVEVELLLANQVVDLVATSIDLAVRVLVKPPRDSTLVAKKVGTVEIGLYAAPAHLARVGTPKKLADLEHHESLRFGGVEVPYARSRIICNDMLTTRALLLEGAALGALPSFLAADDVTAGTLVRVLPSWALRTGTVYLVVPGRRHLAPKLTAFRDLLLEMLRQRPL
jgi:DNA-binding transcriptional LysR family regulator